jgi:hypothetical protein
MSDVPARVRLARAFEAADLPVLAVQALDGCFDDDPDGYLAAILHEAGAHTLAEQIAAGQFRITGSHPSMSAPEPPVTAGTHRVRVGMRRIRAVYVPQLIVEGQVVRAFDAPAATAYALVLGETITHAEYDAAVFTQIVAVGAADSDPHATAREVLTALSATRRMPDPAVTGPLVFSPRLATTGMPFVRVSYQGQPLECWSLPAARDHLLAVLHAPVVAASDADYYEILMRIPAMTPTVAEAMVSALGRCGSPGDPI